MGSVMGIAFHLINEFNPIITYDLIGLLKVLVIPIGLLQNVAFFQCYLH